jgi:hypothetical protein
MAASHAIAAIIEDTPPDAFNIYADADTPPLIDY